MTRPYILRKGVSKLEDLVNGRVGALPVGADGKIFYVDEDSTGAGTGSDSFDGLSPERSKKTLQAAIDATVSNRGDLIICKAATQTVTAEVAFNKNGITVMAEPTGYNSLASGERFVIYGSHTDNPAARITAPCTIIGLGFCGSQTAGASLEIDCDEQGSWPGGWNALINVRFSHWGIAKAYALLIKGGADTLIKDCYFDGLWTGYTTAAIGLQDSGDQGCWNYVIDGNSFYNIGSGKYCIGLASSTNFRQGIVRNNYNVGSAKFFNANSCTGDAVFVCNYMGGATDTGSYNTTIDTLQTAGFDFAGNYYSE